jgi:hypothetical protein
MEFADGKLREGEADDSGSGSDSGGEREGEAVCCSYALTGDKSMYQGVYRCITCTSEAESNKCCCAGCADACHWEHDVEYIGYGLAYCDCGAGSCELFGDSKILAEKVLRTVGSSHIAHDRDGRIAGDSGLTVNEFAEFRWSSLCNSEVRHTLEEQAQALIKFSKETFWLAAGATPRCALEVIAAQVFARHTRGVKLSSSVSCGAEWWVQVKPCNTVRADGSIEGDAAGTASAIDLHYDKDELLAERFAVGVYPQISTVTYLTCGNLTGDITHDGGDDMYSNTAPTIIVDNSMIHPIGRPMNRAFISRPVVGKHIAFDGRNLHGVPSHRALRRIRPTSGGGDFDAHSISDSPVPGAGAGAEERILVESELRSSKEDAEEHQMRITILVNIWIGHHPASVDPLSEEIISFLPEVLPGAMACINPTDGEDICEDIVLIRDIPLVTVYRNPPIPTAVSERSLSSLREAVVIAGPDTGELLKLPFLTADATWGREDDDEEADLILKMWLPDLSAALGCEEDTIQIDYVNNFPTVPSPGKGKGAGTSSKKKKAKRGARDEHSTSSDPLLYLAYDL